MYPDSFLFTHFLLNLLFTRSRLLNIINSQISKNANYDLVTERTTILVLGGTKANMVEALSLSSPGVSCSKIKDVPKDFYVYSGATFNGNPVICGARLKEP